MTSFLLLLLLKQIVNYNHLIPTIWFTLSTCLRSMK
jgi:hypothetical protein